MVLSDHLPPWLTARSSHSAHISWRRYINAKSLTALLVLPQSSAVLRIKLRLGVLSNGLASPCICEKGLVMLRLRSRGVKLYSTSTQGSTICMIFGLVDALLIFANPAINQARWLIKYHSMGAKNC